VSESSDEQLETLLLGTPLGDAAVLDDDDSRCSARVFVLMTVGFGQ